VKWLLTLAWAIFVVGRLTILLTDIDQRPDQIGQLLSFGGNIDRSKEIIALPPTADLTQASLAPARPTLFTSFSVLTHTCRACTYVSDARSGRA
jgi:hypothetical protein